MGIKITPITAYQDTQQSTTSSLTDDNCETGVLANSIDYLVLYCGNFGSSTTSNVGGIGVWHGSTELSEGQGEGAGTNTHWASIQTQGNLIVTGNGTDTLKYRFGVGSGTGYIGSMGIVAIPLTDLVEGTDYWHSGVASSDTPEVTNTSLSGETVRIVEFTVPDAGDYIVLMSVEGNPASSGGSASNASRVQFLLDSTTEICPTETGIGVLQEWEDNLQWDNFAAISLLNLSSGAHDFEIKGYSRSSAIANFRRSRITLIRAASFKQVVQTRDTTGDSTTSSSFVDFSGLDTTFTPTDNNHIVHMTYAVPGNSSVFVTRSQLLNDTDTAAHRINAGEYNNDNGFDTNRDLVPVTMIHSQQYSTAKDWQYQFLTGSGTGVIGKNRSNTAGIESNFVFWELETEDVIVDNPAGMLGCNS